MNDLKLLKSVDWSIEKFGDQYDGINLFIFSCGYEKRSTAIVSKLVGNAKNTQYLCLSFSTLKTAGSREENDKYVSSLGCGHTSHHD